MLIQTFAGSALTRVPFAGAPELYRDLADGGNPFFYVSSSPWNLHSFLSAFLDHRDFPRGPILLRDLIGTRAGRARKHERIEEILALHPQLRFVLIGDSGERDPQIYADIVRDHPGRVLAVYIREVRLDPGDGRVEAVTDALGARRAVRAGGRQRRRTPACRRAGPPVSERRLLLAVDAPSLLHRNHHARADSGLRDQSGRPVWALHGMLRQILEAVDQFAPDAVLFGLDDRRTSVREQAYPAYKAGRAEKDAELVDQLERAADLLDALGLLTVTPDGLEADDVNASAATWAEREGWRCVLITSDRDAFAHISETTQVLRLISGGITGSPLLDPARLWGMYGVAAENYLEFAALRGDASDNLPGVPGIGEKTAPVLLDLMGSMRAVWADIEHCGGATLVATIDSWCEETGQRRMGAALLKRLSADGARERFDFNLSMMSGRTDLDLGLTPDEPGTPGLLPLDPERVLRVVGYLGVPATTDLALRVLTEPPAST